MATVVDVLDDMGFIVASMEAITPRLQNPKLRPSGQEVTQLHELAARILQHAQYLHEKFTVCASGWTPEIFQKSDKHMSQAQLAIQAAAQGKVKWSILRRNLVAIYQGHSTSAVDSPSLRARKARKAEKGRILRGLGAGVILAWAVSLPPSMWDEMDGLVFNDVTKQMMEAAAGGERIAEIALNVRDTIRDLGKEEPFCSIPSYPSFAHEVEGLVRNQRKQHPSKKRRLDENRDVEDSSPPPEPHTGESHVPTSQSAVAAPGLCSGGASPEEALPVDRAPDSSLVQLRYDVPDERLKDLLWLRSAGAGDAFPPIALGVPIDELPGFVFFSVSRVAALQYAFEAGLEAFVA